MVKCAIDPYDVVSCKEFLSECNSEALQGCGEVCVSVVSEYESE